MLSKTICMSDQFNALGDDFSRLLATWVIPHLDMRGVFYADPRIVRAAVFPMRDDVTVERVQYAINMMREVGLIEVFEAGGKAWMVWPKFAEHQTGLRTDRETTQYPDPAKFRTVAGELPERCGNSAGSFPPNSTTFPLQVQVQDQVQVQVQDQFGFGATETARDAAWRELVEKPLREFGIREYTIQELRAGLARVPIDWIVDKVSTFERTRGMRNPGGVLVSRLKEAVEAR